MPPAPRDARSAAAPSRAPWPTPSRPTKPPAQQNAAATDAAQPFVQAPSPPPSARRSCARPASSGQCNSRAAARRDPRGRSHSQSHRQTPQIAIHYRLKSGDHPYWVLSQKRESSPIIDSLHFQLRLSDSVVLATFRRKIGWRWLLDRIDWFAENCKIGRIWVDVGCDHWFI